ncbi:hypothetical protein ACFFF5_07600 [Lederbergia wuyishanensis]|uniref:Uncharacterized protein n=1 Tax=Lederbergia wuyishanensis TaxID=1347903 RepID=A0ABU0D252_9BACI|nr:hypothetical protein [Lederbergia wuyishanensis]MCJ8007351.1 hypothetical protein [Lederbergia wuyishanensis]MDQ0342483.1 hypothetical protein [Lederbergia wuyishanensis]
MKRTFIALVAFALIMLIYTPTIQASENNNHIEKIMNQPGDSSEQQPAADLGDIAASEIETDGAVEEQKEYVISDALNKLAQGSLTDLLKAADQRERSDRAGSGEEVNFRLQEEIIEPQHKEEEPAEAVAEKQPVEEATVDRPSKKSSLLDLQLGEGLLKPLTGDVKLSTLDYSKEEGASRPLDIEIADSPLIGSLKISLLGTEEKTTDTGDETKRSLVEVEVDNQLLGKAKVDVLESQADNTDTYRSIRSRLAKVNVNNPLIGEVNAGVATQDTYESEDLSNRSGGLVSIELKETLVGNVNVDVLKSDGKKTVILDVVTKETPILGNTDINVGIDNPSFTATDPKVKEQPIKKPQKPIVAERPEETSNNVVPENPIETPSDPVNSKQPLEKSEDPDTKEQPKDQKKVKPSIEKSVDTANSNQPATSVDFIDVKEVEQDGKQPDMDEVIDEQILSEKTDDDPLTAAIQKLLEAGNKKQLNNPAKIDTHAAAIYQEEDESNPKDSPYVSQAIMLGSLLSGVGSSSSSGNFSTNTGVGDLFSGKLDVISYMASEMTNKALFKVKTLRTKWNKEPPINPPKQSFFLS